MAEPRSIADTGGEEAEESGVARVHGSFIDVLGLGILITGPSGVGKSECVLELVQRGNRMVADDVVCLSRVCDENGVATLRGRSPDSIRHFLEIRGIGLLCVPELYGDESVVDEANVDLVCHLEKWRESASYERVGFDRPQERLVGVLLPTMVIPVRPATSTATLVEVAGRDALQRKRGFHPARSLDERLRRMARLAHGRASG